MKLHGKPLDENGSIAFRKMTNKDTPTPELDREWWRSRGVEECMDRMALLAMEVNRLSREREADEQELGATMKVLGQALNPTAELTVGGVLEMAQALVERYEAAQSEIAALRELLQRWLNFHTEAAGMTPEIIGEKLAFQRFMDGIDRKEADMINATKDALDAARKAK